MTQDEIIEMWNSVIKYARGEVRITEFAKLVAAKEQKKWQDQTVVEIYEAVLKEREVCAKQVQSWNTAITDQIALAIRARGEQA